MKLKRSKQRLSPQSKANSSKYMLKLTSARRHKHALSLFLCFCSFIFMPHLSFASQWQLVRDEDQVQVFKQTISGQSTRFMVQTRVRATPVALLSLLQDLDNNPNWVEGSLAVSLIKQLSIDENLMRTLLKTPWPFKDRDIVNYSHYWQNRRNCALFVDIQAMPNAIKVDPNYERVINFQANWSAYPMTENDTLIRYSGWLDPGAYIPEIISSPIAIASLFQTFVNMRSQIIKPKYQVLTWGLIDLRPCKPQQYYHNTLG